jgi:Glycosyltransferase family 87
MLVWFYSPYSLMDFRIAYSGARCFVHQQDPYNQSNLYQCFVKSSGEVPHTEAEKYTIDFETRYFYFPSTFAVSVPLSLIPFKYVQVLWVLMNALGFVLAAFLMWELAAENAPLLAGIFLGFYLLNSINYISLGNPVGVAVGFCVIAAWCFLRERFILGGVVCMTISLLIKSHDSGLIFIYFLLAGGMARKRAVQTLTTVIACLLPVAFWLMRVSPHWLSELHANLNSAIGPGGVDDPGPSGVLTRGAAMLTDLQSIFCLIRDDPTFYNFASYAVCGVLLLAWGAMSLRSHQQRERMFLLLAAGAALTMLPFYHRQYDAHLLIIAVPGLALLWSRQDKTKWVALVLTAAAFLATSDLVSVVYLEIFANLHLPTTGFAGTVHVALLSVPVPLILLATCCFYLYAARQAPSVLWKQQAVHSSRVTIS